MFSLMSKRIFSFILCMKKVRKPNYLNTAVYSPILDSNIKCISCFFKGTFYNFIHGEMFSRIMKKAIHRDDLSCIYYKLFLSIS